MMDRSSLVKAGQAASLKYQAYVQRRAARLEWFRLLCEAGESLEEIARRMGVSETHVRDHARDHGFTVPSLARHRRRGQGRKPKSERL
jgi:AraC-like DNA-binding protein